jgi:UDP-GlcNAc:undecaprenyl-phosphate GlcNAc-1-phosphate transferase
MFFIAFVLSLLLTPLARWLGVRLKAFDYPTDRKVHTRPIPRTGGLAIFLSMILANIIANIIYGDKVPLFLKHTQYVYLALGGIFIFAVGFFDDFKRLGPKVKFLCQIAAATIAFYAGVRIEFLFGINIQGVFFNVFSWAITVLWFLLIINAINLIDGLDGLAAGVTFIAMCVLSIVNAVEGHFVTMSKVVIMAGVLLGFLRYNFNPATSGLSILLPVVILGVPIFDTLIAPLRRFFSGKKLFLPDKLHIHHLLLRKGFTQKKVVLIIYSITVALCALALIMIFFRNNIATGVIVTLMALLALIGVNKLGYLEYVILDKILGWIRDITDASRNSTYSGTFLTLAAELGKTDSLKSLWAKACQAFEFMQIDAAELHIKKPAKLKSKNQPKQADVLSWEKSNAPRNKMMRLEIPLGAGNPVNAKLIVFKNLSENNIRPYTLRRVRQLRQNMETALERIIK